MLRSRSLQHLAGRDQDLSVSRPNFAFSPPLGDHLPEPLLCNRTRMPIMRLDARLLSRREDRLLELFQSFRPTMMTGLSSLRPKQRNPNKSRDPCSRCK